VRWWTFLSAAAAKWRSISNQTMSESSYVGDDRDIILEGDTVLRTGAIVDVPVIGPPIDGCASLEKCKRLRATSNDEHYEGLDGKK
jgi:hypothetical protein